MAVNGKVTEKHKKDVFWTEEKAGGRHRTGRMWRRPISAPRDQNHSELGARALNLQDLWKGMLGQILCSSALSPSVNKTVHEKRARKVLL